MSQQVPRSDLVDNLLADLTALEDRVAELENERDRLTDLESRVDDIDERTDMLRLIEESDAMTGRQRSAALIQHAIEEVRTSGRTRTTFDRDRADDILHYPDVDRTTIYTDMRRCERMIGDPEVCWYTSASASETGAAEVTFDLAHVNDTVDASTLIERGD